MVQSIDPKTKILESLDIQAFYQSEVEKLGKPNGKGQTIGICPFHDDKNPSCSFDLATGYFNCFGCGEKGSVFDFYMKKRGVDFPTALSALAKLAGTNNRPKRRRRGQTVKQFFGPVDIESIKHSELGRPDEVYVYTCEQGVKHYLYVCRFNHSGDRQEKTFRQCRPDGKGGVVWSTKDIELVPYNLPKLSKSQYCFLVEGEKDVETLRWINLVASCNPMGAGTWRDEFNRHFKGKKVAIIPDNDEQGHSHALKVARSLHGVATSTKIVELPDLPDKGDVSDWLEASHTKGELLSLAQAKEEWKPEQFRPQASISTEDQTPLPLMRKNEPGEPFPMDCLGRIGSPAAKMIFKIIKAPDAVCAHAILGFMSFIVQGHANVVIDGRKYPLNEFFLSICSRSGRKSEADKATGATHRKVQRLKMQEYGTKKLKYRDEMEAYNKTKADINSDKSLNLEAKKAELLKLREQEPSPPYEPVTLFSDPTVEGIHKLFERGTPSKFLCADEGGQFTGGHSMTAEKQMYAAATYSKWWDAAPIDRIRGGDGASILYGRRLSCHLMMQEKVALEFFSNELMRNQGLLSRFIVAYPESLVGQRTYVSVNLSETPEMQAYREHVEQLLKIPLPMRVDEKSGLILNELEPRTISFEPNAKKLWIDAYEGIEAESGKGRIFEVIEGFSGKAAEHIVRLAGILAVFDNVEHCRAVEKPYVEKAITLMEYYLNERVRITTIATPDQNIAVAQKLIDWIHEKKLRVVTLPDIYRCGPSRTQSANDARRIARILTDHGWIQKLDKSYASEIDQRKSREAWRVIDEKI